MPEPSFLWVPEHDDTLGDIAADLGNDLGLPPDEDQRSILDAIYAFRDDQPDVPACFEVGIVAPRQNIKTSTLEIAALTDLFVFREPLHIWTAHLFKTAQETFKHMCLLIESNREYRRMCKKPRTANGDEAIVLLTGEEIQFHARSKGGGRGLTARKVTLDEGLFLQGQDIGALVPTLATVAEAQIRYGSSAGMVGSDVLRGIRDRGRPGGDPSLAYFEWTADKRECAKGDQCMHGPVGSVEGCALDDRELWAQANPALGRRITITTLSNLRRSMPAGEFMREFLSWWEDPIDAIGLPLEAWAELGKPKAKLANPVTFAVDVAPGHGSAAIAACGGPIEIVDHRAGVSWTVARLVELVEKQKPAAIGLDPSGPASSLIPDLEKAGFKIRSAAEPDGLLVLLSGTESVQACSGFFAGIVEGTLVHRNQPALNDALAGAGRRQVGDAWKWSRRDSSVDIAPLVAATVARFLWVQPESPESPVIAMVLGGA